MEGGGVLVFFVAAKLKPVINNTEMCYLFSSPLYLGFSGNFYTTKQNLTFLGEAPFLSVDPVFQNLMTFIPDGCPQKMTTRSSYLDALTNSYPVAPGIFGK